jgi:hypothetical protein
MFINMQERAQMLDNEESVYMDPDMGGLTQGDKQTSACTQCVNA